MRVDVLCISFSAKEIDQFTLQNIKNAVNSEFNSVFPRQPPLEIEIASASGPKCDVLIVLERYPTDRLSNPVQRAEKLADRVASRLEALLPKTVPYAGRVICRQACDLPKLRGAGEDRAVYGGNGRGGPDEPLEAEYERLAAQFEARPARYTFKRLVISKEVERRLLSAIAVLENRRVLFEEWGLGSIMSPSVLLNLYGSSGTGKTMAAEAIADRLGKRIIRASYADIESKYHGEGPKRLKGLFRAAKNQDAVLFIDEADSMLSARLTDTGESSAQTINSMRSQLLMSLEEHDGIVIFATNLIENYDNAFLTRLVCVEMERPDFEARKKIWKNHLYPIGEGAALNIPLSGDVNLDKLAEYDFCGRDIRNAVKQGCINAVLRKAKVVTQADLLEACRTTQEELQRLARISKSGQLSMRGAAAGDRERLAAKAAEKVLAGSGAEKNGPDGSF